MRDKRPLSIAQIGPYPPPYGGVAVHIRRLHRRLLGLGIKSRIYCEPGWKLEKCESEVFPRRVITKKPLSYFNWLFEPGWKIDANIVHYHYSWDNFSPAICAMLLRGKKIAITVHNQMDNDRWSSRTKIQKLMCLVLVNSSAVFWIAVSGHIKEQLIKIGVSENKITVLTAYIAPEYSSEAEINVPLAVKNFTKVHSPLLTVYGWRLWLDETGTDLYGFDLSIDVIRELKVEYPNIGLIICLPNIYLDDYFIELKKRILAGGLSESILLLTEPMEEAWPLWILSDLYIRPTNTDGDSVAVREALSLGIPVVASDASPRPEGVVLFRSRSLPSFTSAVKAVLQPGKKKSSKSVSPNVQQDATFAALIDLYQRIASK